MSTTQKPIELREADFRKKVNTYSRLPENMRDKFIDYWTEKSEGAKKMRYEKETTFDIGRRIGRWIERWEHDQKFKPGAPAHAKVIPIKKQPQTDIERLDRLLETYRKNPTGIPFDDLAAWYQPVKDNHLWPPTITKGEVNEIRELYKGNEIKCRAWVVERTLIYYENNGWTFSNTIEARQKLAR